MAIVYRGRRRKFVESEHPRNPRTGEFVEKTGGHASWLMRIANRTQGPNLGGGFVKSGGTLRPTGGKASVGSLKGGEHAKVVGVDQYGKPTSLTGYVQGKPGPVTVRQRGKRTPMLAVSMAETPSGGGANWRGTVYVKPDAQIERTRPKADVARLEGGGSLDERIAAVQRQMADLGANEGATIRRMELQSQLTKLRKQRVAENPALAAQLSARMEAQAVERAAAKARPDLIKIMRDAGIGDPPAEMGGQQTLGRANSRLRRGDDPRDIAKDLRENARSIKGELANLSDDDTDTVQANGMRVTARILNDVADRLDAIDNQSGVQGKPVDTPRVKQDDGGMAPTQSTPSGKPITNMINAVADELEREYPSARERHAHWSGTPSPSTVEALRTIAKMHEDGRLNKQNTMMALNRIAINEARSTEGGEVAKLAKAIKKAPARTPKTGLSLPDLRDESGKPPAASKVANAVNVLKSTKSRDEARAALDGLTVAQLKQVYAGLNRTPAATRKADMVDRLIHTTVGSRINSQVLRGDGPNSWANDTVTARRAAALAEAEKPFTPLRDADPNSREGMAASMRQLPGAALRGTAAELEAGDITPREAADRLSQFRRSLAGRTMSEVDQRAVGDLETRLRAADRASLGLDKPAPTPPATAYASITKRATLLAMLRQRGLKAKRGAPDDMLRQILIDDDSNRAAGISAATPPAGAAPRVVETRSRAVNDAVTVESLAAMKRPALLAVRRNTPGARNLRRGASEREIAEEIVRARNASAAADRADTQAIMTADLGKAPVAPNMVLGHSIRNEHIGATVRFTVPDRFGRADKDKTYEGTLLEARSIDGQQMAVQLSGTKGSAWMPKDTPIEILAPRPDTPEHRRYAEALEKYHRANNAVSAAKYANTRPTQSNDEVRARGDAETASRELTAARQALVASLAPSAPAAPARTPISDNDLAGDIPAAVNRLATMPAADARKLLDAQRHSTLTDLARALNVRVAPTTPSLIKNIESGLKVERLERMRQRTPAAPEPSTPAGMSPLRLDSQIEAAERLIAQTRDALEVEQERRGTGGMLTDREIGLDAQLKATERKLRDLRAEKTKRSDDITISPLTTEATVADIAAGIEVRRRRLASMRQRGASSADIAEAEVDMAAMQTRLSAAVRAETPPRPESQADIFRRHSQLTRAQFEAMPQDARDRVIAELKGVRDSGEEQSYTNPSNRDSMGITSRGLREANHVRGAREKIRELTYVAPPPVDNSVRGRAARLREGDRYALEGATIAELGEIAEVAGFRRPGPSWKRDKAVEYLRNRAIIGDKMPTSYRPIQMAETMRGMDRGQALALLDYVEADFGITKTDMKEIARELGVTLRNGDKRAMMHALAAAAKDAPGKA